MVSIAWRSSRFPDRRFLLEVFVAVNLAFLAVDIVLAHSVNRFRHVAEWIPLGFGICGAVALGAPLVGGGGDPTTGPLRRIGLVVGWLAIAVGLAGLLWHLDSQFFQVRTLRSLVYSAPFVAPLAFAGLGLLLLLDRLGPSHDLEWSGWVVGLALGGVAGNFALSLADHAQNGFFYATEWVPVVVSAIGVGYLVAVLLGRPTPGCLRLGLGILGLQVVTGFVGTALHLYPLASPSVADWFDRIVFGPPPFAPLLFADLAVLAGLGLWGLDAQPDAVGQTPLDETPGGMRRAGSARR